MEVVDRPLCECHGQPMWKTGKGWTCKVKQAERTKRLRPRYAEQNRQYREVNIDKIREHDRQRNSEFRTWVAQMKGTTCAECGQQFGSQALDFHHVDPTTKSFTISKYEVRDREKVLAEIAKCRVLCKPCHTMTHHLLEETREEIRTG